MGNAGNLSDRTGLWLGTEKFAEMKGKKMGLMEVSGRSLNVVIVVKCLGLDKL